MSKIRIVLADDHGVVREGLKMLIDAQTDMEVIGESLDGQMAYEMILTLVPDLAVLDVSMPVMNGVELVTRLKAAACATRLLVLTANEERGYMQQMLKLGASGYLLKRSAAGELIRAIRTVAGGGNYLDPAVVQDMVGDLFDNKGVDPDVSKVILSDREREVIRLIAQGFTNKEIAVRLDISPKTVETYKSRSMAKLDLRGRTDLVRFVISQGWLTE